MCNIKGMIRELQSLDKKMVGQDNSDISPTNLC